MTILAIAFIFFMVIFLCKDLIKAKSNRLISFIFILIFGVPFLIFGIVMSLEVLRSFMESIFQAFIIVGIVLQNYLFIKWIPRYTQEGMRIKEDIDGFKMFINVAKDDDFKDKTPEMFDKYFAYAYVLGLENKWASKFEDILKQDPANVYEKMDYQTKIIYRNAIKEIAKKTKISEIYIASPIDVQ